jgi:hypothetical protein
VAYGERLANIWQPVEASREAGIAALSTSDRYLDATRKCAERGSNATDLNTDAAPSESTSPSRRSRQEEPRGRRAVELMKQFATELGGDLTTGQHLAVGRAATLCALAEDARIRKLNGATDICFDDLVRLDHAAALAVKQFGIKSAPAKAQVPNLREYVAPMGGRT